jgi:hypothetical protein
VRFHVSGVRVQDISVDVEADSASEAILKAHQAKHRDIDVWDTDLSFTGAIEET